MSIIVDELSFSYEKSNQVLKEISFSVPDGQILAVVGPSGCGKSTLLKVVSGLLPNNHEHQIKHKSLLIKGLNPDKYVDTGKISFMFQEPTLFPNLTVSENIGFPLKMRKDGAKDKIDALINKMGLSPYRHFLPRNLSGGMKTRVALGRSFVINPELLLLDEPFAALDVGWKYNLYQEFINLKDQNAQTVILVTHDIQEALLISNQIIVMSKNGSILSRHSIPLDIKTSQRLNNIYDFLHNPEINDLYLSIQKQIIDDSRRRNLEKESFELFLNTIVSSAGTDKEKDEKTIDCLYQIRKYTNNEIVFRKLYKAFKKASVDFKYELIWELLNYNSIDENEKRDIFEFYYSHIESFSKKSIEFYQTKKATNLFELLIGRINQSNIPNSKKWIYLCDMYALRNDHLPEVERYLQKVVKVNGINNDHFDSMVARKVLQKLEIEK